MNDIMKAIADLKKSLSEILSSNFTISMLQTLQFADFKKDVLNLSTNLNVLQDDNISFRNELSTLKNRVLFIESIPSEIKKMSTSLL